MKQKGFVDLIAVALVLAVVSATSLNFADRARDKNPPKATEAPSFSNPVARATAGNWTLPVGGQPATRDASRYVNRGTADDTESGSGEGSGS